MQIDFDKYIKKQPVLAKIIQGKPAFWPNLNLLPNDEIWQHEQYSIHDIEEADADLHRYAPLIAVIFPETAKTNGIIESPLKPIPKMAAKLNERHPFYGKLYLKMDSELPVAGSIKARGGLYEVFKHAETLALEHHLLTSKDDDYTKLATPAAKKFFSQYTVQVASTGNLGLSIGIVASALGFKAIVHMSSDAKQWKKDLLRQKGAQVIEYQDDFDKALDEGRERSKQDPYSYFVDDVRSKYLFMGYAVAALRLKKQLAEQHITVDNDHPIFVYSPAGVGGSSGGVAFGVKAVFGDAAHAFFVEPAVCPSIILGMVTGLNNKISVHDVGLDGKTEADGLACPSPSVISGDIMQPLLSGIFTVADKTLFEYLRDLYDSEGITIEPSSCATLAGPDQLFTDKLALQYLQDHNLADKKDNITHIGWATGGSIVPEAINKQNLNIYL